MVTEQQRKRLEQFLNESDEPDVEPVPLEPEMEARLVKAALQAHAGAAGGTKAEPGPVIDLSARRARRRWWMWGSTLATVAAAACVLVLTGVFDGAPMSVYSGGARRIDPRLMGDDESKFFAEVRIAPGDRLELDLQPPSEVTDPVEARAYLYRDGHVSALMAVFECSKRGRCRATLGESPLPEPGEAVIGLVIARRGHLPGEERIARALRGQAAESSRHWQIHRVKVTAATDSIAPR